MGVLGTCCYSKRLLLAQSVRLHRMVFRSIRPRAIRLMSARSGVQRRSGRSPIVALPYARRNNPIALYPLPTTGSAARPSQSAMSDA